MVLGASLALATPGLADDGGEGDGDDDTHATATGDHDELEIAGEIPASCAFTQLPNDTNLGSAAQNLEKEVGILGFTCNLAELSTVSITVKSQYGALKRATGSETIAYAAKWAAVPALSAYTAATAWFPNAAGVSALTAANGVQKSGQLTIRLMGAPGYAGNYSDTLTFTVAP
jgi:hypothetical protein